MQPIPSILSQKNQENALHWIFRHLKYIGRLGDDTLQKKEHTETKGPDVSQERPEEKESLLVDVLYPIQGKPCLASNILQSSWALRKQVLTR